MKQALQTSGYAEMHQRCSQERNQAVSVPGGAPDPRSPQGAVVLTMPAGRVSQRPGYTGYASCAAISFELVYRRHAGFVRSVLTAMGMAASVDDALQDVFVVVHRRLREFDGQYSLRSWLYAIARRVASHYRRSLRRALVCECIDHDVADRAPGPLELVQQRETVDELGALLAEMDPEKRELLVLADIEERSVPEIAELTGTGLSTVYTRLRRARRSLQSTAGWQHLLSQRVHEHREVIACGS